MKYGEKWKEKILKFCLLNKQKSVHTVFLVGKCIIMKNLRFIKGKGNMSRSYKKEESS